MIFAKETTAYLNLCLELSYFPTQNLEHLFNEISITTHFYYQKYFYSASLSKHASRFIVDEML